MKATLFLACAFVLSIGCVSPKTAPFATALNWITKSREYKAVCLQAYANAWEKLEPVVQKEPGKWAIVMDLDETVLDNSGYQRQLEVSGASHSQAAWELWVSRSEAGLVPGAKEFIKKVRTLQHGRIIFISNRYARGIEATLLNLKKHGLTSANDIYLLRANRKDTKSNRRQEVSKGTGRLASHGAFKVLAWFGDAAHDFPDDPKLKWGTHKFMLPNPVYGNWDE